MAIISVGSLWTSNATGYVYEVVALTPRILYSPITTYTTRIHDSKIFSATVDDFLSRMTEGGSRGFVLLSAINGQPLTSAINGSVLLSARM